jgi:hypothetical protein
MYVRVRMCVCVCVSLSVCVCVCCEGRMDCGSLLCDEGTLRRDDVLGRTRSLSHPLEHCKSTEHPFYLCNTFPFIASVVIKSRFRLV